MQGGYGDGQDTRTINSGQVIQVGALPEVGGRALAGAHGHAEQRGRVEDLSLRAVVPAGVDHWRAGGASSLQAQIASGANAAMGTGYVEGSPSAGAASRFATFLSADLFHHERSVAGTARESGRARTEGEGGTDAFSDAFGLRADSFSGPLPLTNQVGFSQMERSNLNYVHDFSSMPLMSGDQPPAAIPILHERSVFGGAVNSRLPTGEWHPGTGGAVNTRSSIVQGMTNSVAVNSQALVACEIPEQPMLSPPSRSCNSPDSWSPFRPSSFYMPEVAASSVPQIAQPLLPYSPQLYSQQTTAVPIEDETFLQTLERIIDSAPVRSTKRSPSESSLVPVSVLRRIYDTENVNARALMQRAVESRIERAEQELSVRVQVEFSAFSEEQFAIRQRAAQESAELLAQREAAEQALYAEALTMQQQWSSQQQLLEHHLQDEQRQMRAHASSQVQAELEQVALSMRRQSVVLESQLRSEEQAVGIRRHQLRAEA